MSPKILIFMPWVFLLEYLFAYTICGSNPNSKSFLWLFICKVISPKCSKQIFFLKVNILPSLLRPPSPANTGWAAIRRQQMAHELFILPDDDKVVDDLESMIFLERPVYMYIYIYIYIYNHLFAAAFEPKMELYIPEISSSILPDLQQGIIHRIYDIKDSFFRG